MIVQIATNWYDKKLQSESTILGLHDFLFDSLSQTFLGNILAFELGKVVAAKLQS